MGGTGTKLTSHDLHADGQAGHLHRVVDTFATLSAVDGRLDDLAPWWTLLEECGRDSVLHGVDEGDRHDPGSGFDDVVENRSDGKGRAYKVMLASY